MTLKFCFILVHQSLCHCAVFNHQSNEKEPVDYILVNSSLLKVFEKWFMVNSNITLLSWIFAQMKL